MEFQTINRIIGKYAVKKKRERFAKFLESKIE